VTPPDARVEVGPDPDRGAADLGRDYASSGFGRRLGFGERPALVVVDFVDAYLVPGSPFYAGVEDTLAAATLLLRGARDAGIPVLHTRVEFGPDGLDGGVFFRKAAGLAVFVGDQPLGQIAAPLTPLPSEVVIRKQSASAFFGTPLATLLTAQRVDTLLIAGLSTSGCVRATAVDAVQHGFIPVVVREAVGDRDPRPHEASLFDLQAKYADVEGLEEVLAHLRSRSTLRTDGHP